MNASVRKKLITTFIAMGISAPSAYFAYDVTLPSEGLILSPYVAPEGNITYCVGHLATKQDKLKDKYSEEECMVLFAKDFKKHQEETDKMVGGKDKFASEWQRAAVTDMTFNNGPSLIEKSTMISLIKQGKHEQACDQLIRWVYAKGKVLGGLVTRREKTMPYCLGKLPYEKQLDYQKFLKEYEDEKNKANK